MRRAPVDAHRRACALALVLLLTGACRQTPARTFVPAEYPGVLRQPEAFAFDGLWRQQVTARWGDGEVRGFPAVVQKAGTVLTVLGLSPAGTVGFSVVLKQGKVDLVNNMPDEVPFEPRFILLDVQRAFYPWLDDAREAEPRADGRHEGVVDGELVVEHWSKGRLRQRTFSRVSGDPAGEIDIRYVWEDDDGVMPARTVLNNAWFGYELTIETNEETLFHVVEDSAVEEGEPR